MPRSSSSGGPPLLPVPEDMRRNQPSPRGGRGGRGGMPPLGGPVGSRGGHVGFQRPGSSGGMMSGSKAAAAMSAPGPSGLGVGSGVTAAVAGGSGGESLHHHHPHHPPNRPDLQKLGLKFGGQISITSTGNQGGKRGGGAGGPGGGGGGVDAQGVSITKLKGDMPVGSPVSIRDATTKQQQGGGGQGPAGPSSSSGRPEQEGAGVIKVGLVLGIYQSFC